MMGLQERVVGAAEHEGVGVQALGSGFGAEFFEVDAHDFGGHGPAVGRTRLAPH